MNFNFNYFIQKYVYYYVNYCFRFEIQLSLLKSSWSQLFILGLTQCAQTLSLIPVLSSMITHLQNEEIHNSPNSSKAKEVKNVIIYCTYIFISIYNA